MAKKVKVKTPALPVANPLLVRPSGKDPVLAEWLLRNEYQRGFMDARNKLAESMLKEIYSAVAITLKEQFGFGKVRIRRTLGGVDDVITTRVLDSDEAIDLAYEKCGLRFVFESLDRVEEL